MNTLRESLRALPKSAWILFFGTFLNKFGTFVVPFLSIYLVRQGFSAAQAGLAVGAYGLGTLIAAALGGYLADSLGRKKTIVLSMFSVAVTMLCLSQARSLPMVLWFAGLAGLTGELYRPASTAFLADLVPAGQRLTAFAAYRIAFNAGWTFGPALAGLLAQNSFFWLFLGDAVTSLLYGIVAWLALPASPSSRRLEQGWREIITAVRQDKRFIQLLCAALVVGLVFMQICSTLSLEITRHGISAGTYGLLISLNGMLVVLFELPITRLTRRYPPRWMIACGFVLIGTGFALNALAQTTRDFALNMLVFTLGEMICMPVTSAYVADLAPSSLRGRYMGTSGLVWALAYVFGPSLGLWLFSFNPALLWWSCGGLGLLAGAIILCEVKVECLAVERPMTT